MGGERVILLSASTWGLITVATPVLAHLSSTHLVSMAFSRILTGLLQGVYFPALTSLLSQRVPESERAFTYSTVGAGSQFGTLVTGSVGSLLLDWGGWQSVFYFSGGLTLLWVCYVHRYLLSGKDRILALGVLVQGLPLVRPSKVPWRQLFRKPSVWAAICSQLSSACSFFILLSWLPTFFKETFPHSKGWVFNVVPWLVAIPASLFSGFLSDQLISQGECGLAVPSPRPCYDGEGPHLPASLGVDIAPSSSGLGSPLKGGVDAARSHSGSGALSHGPAEPLGLCRRGRHTVVRGRMCPDLLLNPQSPEEVVLTLSSPRTSGSTRHTQGKVLRPVPILRLWCFSSAQHHEAGAHQPLEPQTRERLWITSLSPPA
ncbi:PREDICTED: solute carrier family 17 member 9 isoform X3 [Chinchilla lanigera]|nr:PREDICTED: solute carrier family 17 member 9 isoform X3 [Chinchilla lanigera]